MASMKAPMGRLIYNRTDSHVQGWDRPITRENSDIDYRSDEPASWGSNEERFAESVVPYGKTTKQPDTEDPLARQVFVGGLSAHVTKKELSWAFSYFGRVTHIRIMSRPDGSARGFAFIKYKCAKSAEAAVQKGYLTVGGVTTEIRYCISVNESEKYKDIKLKSKVFIGRLPKTISKSDLLKYLSQFGEVVEFTQSQHPVTNQPKGYGFATFAEQSSVDRFLSKKGGHQIKGKRLRVGPAEAKKFSNYQKNQNSFNQDNSDQAPQESVDPSSEYIEELDPTTSGRGPRKWIELCHTDDNLCFNYATSKSKLHFLTRYF